MSIRNKLMRSVRRAFALLSLLMVVLASSPTASAKQTTLPVKPGWDVFDSGTGYVIYSVTSGQKACKPKLQVTYILQRAKPNQTYDISIGIYGLKTDFLKSFGVPRLQRASFTREGTEAMQDSFIVGKFTTDGSGNGQTNVELDLTGVPAGAYDAHFAWTRITDTRAFYRTGTSYGQGFAKIVVP
jgi:hypothetical protein